MEGLSWLNAEESWMNRVRHTKKPVVVYGMGNGADKLFALLEEQGVAVADVMASDGFVRGHVYRGFRVKTYREICERYGDVLILLAFATDLADVMEGIHRIAREQEVYAPELPVFGGGIFDAAYAETHAGELAEVYARLADGESRRVMAGLLNFRLHGRMEELEAIASPRARHIGRSCGSPGKRRMPTWVPIRGTRSGNFWSAREDTGASLPWNRQKRILKSWRNMQRKTIWKTRNCTGWRHTAARRF